MNVLADDPLTLAYHELRSPLGLLVTSAHAIADDAPDPAIRARVAVMARAAERMLRTASQVFEFARAGTLGEPEPYRPAASVREIAADLGGLAVNLELDIAARADAIRLYGHRSAFEAIVQSLINNALEHGDATRPVTIRVADEPGSCTVTVENWLPGARRSRGLGAGLHLCRRLAAHLGAVLETEAGGDRFSARLLLPG